MSASILVVEDEFLIAQDIAEALAEAGFAVLGPCPTVAEALARMDESPACAAALLDASLRQVSSEPVAEALAARGIPFAVLTGFSADQLPSVMAAAPVLTKPLDMADIAGLVRALVKGA